MVTAKLLKLNKQRYSAVHNLQCTGAAYHGETEQFCIFLQYAKPYVVLIFSSNMAKAALLFCSSKRDWLPSGAARMRAPCLLLIIHAIKSQLAMHSQL